MKNRGLEPSKEASDAARFQANRITLSATTRENVAAAGSRTGFRAGEERQR